MARYVHDRQGLKDLAVSAAMHLMLIEKAFAAKEYAISISPDAPPYGEGYIASFEVDGSHTERIAGVRRAVAYVRNTSDHAIYVEAGNGRGGKAHHVLARTASWLERS